MTSHPLRIAGLMLFIGLLLSFAAEAADWRVKPIRLDLDAKSKTGAITLINDGEKDLSFQVNAMLWTQDAQGKDVYTPSEDLIFFPKILTLEPHKERIIRAGIKIPATGSEKTYRLFIEELPSKNDAEGTVIAVKVRFGVPVFVAPLESKATGEIRDLRLEDGNLKATVVNTGNTHMRIVSLTAVGRDTRGEDVFRNRIDGWYLLTAARREYAVPVSADACRKSASLTLEIDGQYVDLEDKLPPGSFNCSNALR